LKRPNDFNGDLRSDVFWETASGALAVWTMDNGNQIVAADYVRLGQVITGKPGSDWHLVGTDAMPADFDGDGKGDLLWWTDSGAVAIWRMNGSQIAGADYLHLGANIVGRPAPDWHIIDIGDFNGDAKADILWQTDGGALAIWQMDGTQITAADYIRLGANAVGRPGADWHVLGVADFDGDEKGDLLWQTDGGALAIWTMDGTHIKSADYLRLGSNQVGRPAPNWHVAGLGDFDGDGKADLLWHTDANGAVAFWEMDGTHIKAASYMTFGAASRTQIPDPDWRVAQVGHFDGDGKADILWREANGELDVFEMNGFMLAQPGRVSIGQNPVNVPAPDWTIVAHQYDLL